MKAFRGVDNHIRLFRPMLNMERMHRSADRSCLPVSPERFRVCLLSAFINRTEGAAF